MMRWANPHNSAFAETHKMLWLLRAWGTLTAHVLGTTALRQAAAARAVADESPL